MNQDSNLGKRKYEDEVVTLQQVPMSIDRHVNHQQQWSRNQIICMNEDRLRRELGDDKNQQLLAVPGSAYDQQNGQGPMKVFIINQPVRNVIRHGNNLIVETEPSKNGQNGGALDQQSPQTVQPIMTSQMSPEAEIANNVNFLKAGMPQDEPVVSNGSRLKPLQTGSVNDLNDQGEMSIQQLLERNPNSIQKQDQKYDQSSSPQIMTEKGPVEPQPIEKVANAKTKAKRKPVPNHQKDDLYWERRRKNNLAAKRSRESRRNRDNQITIKTSLLETENMELREKINQVRCELLDVKEKLQEYNVIYRGSEVQKMAEAAAL